MAQETFLVLILAGILSSISGAPITLEQLYQLRKECPSSNAGDAVFIPHPTNCNEYFVCDYGRPIGMSCLPDLHFSPSSRVCDYPYRAGCKGSGFKSVTSSKGGFNVVVNQRQNLMRKDVRCPPKNREILYFLPHEVNCNEYYVCDNGWSVWMTCPGALHFNTDKNICDYPQNVQCKTGAPEHAPTGPVARSAAIVEHESQQPDNSLQSSPGKRDVRCPLRNGAIPVFLAHETNCASYYVCDSGLAILMGCPHHLLFNKDKNVCDQPENVDCPDHQQEPRSAEPAALQAPVGPAAAPLAALEGESNSFQASPGKRDVRCPLRNGAMPVFLSHDTNCASYYVCDSGLAILMSCPHHLLFNKDKNVCDQPENVECVNQEKEERSAEPTFLEGPESSKSSVSADYAMAPHMKKDPRCPRWNPVTPVFLTHETECGMYYVCDWGYAFLMHCPQSLGFNPETNICSLSQPC